MQVSATELKPWQDCVGDITWRRLHLRGTRKVAVRSDLLTESQYVQVELIVYAPMRDEMLCSGTQHEYVGETSC